MADRQEFKFVVDGLELSQSQQEQIGVAIQRAALSALRDVKADLESPVIVGHSSLRLNPGWRGLVLLNGRLGEGFAQKIDEIGFLTP